MRQIGFDERTTIGALDLEECLVLLRWENIGRLAVAAHGESPLVVPVNFVLHEGHVIFRSGDGATLASIREHPVSLQVDRFDQYRRIGWSVLVRGTTHEIDPAEAPGVVIDTWAPARSRHLVRIVPAAISGRRIELVHDEDRRGYL